MISFYFVFQNTSPEAVLKTFQHFEFLYSTSTRVEGNWWIFHSPISLVPIRIRLREWKYALCFLKGSFKRNKEGSRKMVRESVRIIKLSKIHSSVVTVCFDFNKAFDKINLILLIFKMHHLFPILCGLILESEICHRHSSTRRKNFSLSDPKAGKSCRYPGGPCIIDPSALVIYFATCPR